MKKRDYELTNMKYDITEIKIMCKQMVDQKHYYSSGKVDSPKA